VETHRNDNLIEVTIGDYIYGIIFVGYLYNMAIRLTHYPCLNIGSCVEVDWVMGLGARKGSGLASSDSSMTNNALCDPMNHRDGGLRFT
jgi:hypothetical protein